MWERGKTPPHFTVSDCVLVARVSRQGKHRKLMNTWTGPWRVANDDKEHAYAVQHLITAELRDVHVARMRFYADDQLKITDELLKVFQQLENQGEYHIRSISSINRRRVRCHGDLGRTGGGGEHLRAGVTRAP